MRGSEARDLKSLKFVMRDGRYILIMEAIPGDPVACADSFARASWKSLKKHVWLCLVDRLFWTDHKNSIALCCLVCCLVWDGAA